MTEGFKHFPGAELVLQYASATSLCSFLLGVLAPTKSVLKLHLILSTCVFCCVWGRAGRMLRMSHQTQVFVWATSQFGNWLSLNHQKTHARWTTRNQAVYKPYGQRLQIKTTVWKKLRHLLRNRKIGAGIVALYSKPEVFRIRWLRLRKEPFLFALNYTKQ